MKKIALLFALLLAGSALFLGGWGGRVKRGVVVNGEAVGGMPLAAAEHTLRGKLERIPLVLH